MKKQIKQVMEICPETIDFCLREDIMVDCYALIIEMLLEKCFFSENPLHKEEALLAIQILLGSVGKEVHKNDIVF